MPAGWHTPRLYLALAHLGLLAACGVIAFDPRGVDGFHYHPRMLAVVHLMTLGWLSASLLGCLLLVARSVPSGTETSSSGGESGDAGGAAGGATRIGDRVSLALYALGFSGLVSHFWIGEASGVGWSGLLVVLVLLREGARAIARLAGRARESARPNGDFLPYLALAFLNLGLSAGLGMALVVDRYFEVLPGRTLDQVYAHAHLAAIGWAGMLFRGLAGLAAAPRGSRGGGSWRLWAMQAAALAAAAGFLLPEEGRGPATLLAAALLAATARPLREAADRWLLAAIILGSMLAFLPGAGREPRLVIAYGVVAFVGWLGQGVLELQHRLGPQAPDVRMFRMWSSGAGVLGLSFVYGWIPGLVLGTLFLAAAGALSARAWLQASPSPPSSSSSSSSPP